MPEGGAHEPVGPHLLDAAVTSARPRCVALEVAECRCHGGVVSVGHGADDLGLTESEDDGHGLGCSERQIEPWDPAASRGTEPCPGYWVTAVEDGRERVTVHLPDESQLRSADTLPAAWCLSVEVVVLDTPGDGVEVVTLLALGQLPDAQHGGPRRLAKAATATRASGASS
jgi:hypothetical protein